MSDVYTSSWDGFLGPFYAEASLPHHGIQETEGLIGLRTSDGVIVYPHA